MKKKKKKKKIKALRVMMGGVAWNSIGIEIYFEIKTKKKKNTKNKKKKKKKKKKKATTHKRIQIYL